MQLYCFNVVNDFSVSDLRGQDEAIAHAKQLAQSVKNLGLLSGSPLKIVAVDDVGKVVFECALGLDSDPA
jgi:hypothetical protein